MWEQTDVLHYRRHALVQFESFACDHCTPCIQTDAACLARKSIVDTLIHLRTRITAFATFRSPRRSLPNGHARCAPRSSRGWHPYPSIDGQQSRHAPVSPYSNRLPTICQLGGDEEGLLVSLQHLPPHFGADAFRCGCIIGRRLQTSTSPFAERRRRRRARHSVRHR